LTNVARDKRAKGEYRASCGYRDAGIEELLGGFVAPPGF